MIRDNFHLFEMSGEHFIEILARQEPHRTQTARRLIRENIMKVRDAANMDNDKYLRSYPALQRAADIAFSNPVNSTVGRVRQWLKDIGASLSVVTVVLLLCAGMGGL